MFGKRAKIIKTAVYEGPERRLEARSRRKRGERRKTVRWEPKSRDRRRIQSGRRRADKIHFSGQNLFSGLY